MAEGDVEEEYRSLCSDSRTPHENQKPTEIKREDSYVDKKKKRKKGRNCVPYQRDPLEATTTAACLARPFFFSFPVE